MEPTNIETLYFPLESWVPKQFFLNYTVLLTLTLAILWFFHFFEIQANKSKKLEKHKINSVAPQNKTFPTHLNFFWIELPIFEGLITLRSIQKYGVEAISKMASKHIGTPGFQLHVGPVKAILVTNARMCQKILSSTDPGHLSKPQHIYERIFVEWIRHGMVSSKYNVWVKQRKVISRAFTYRALNSYTETMNTHAKNLVRGWLGSETSSRRTGRVVEGNELYNSITINMIGSMLEIIMGTGQCTKEDCNIFADYYLEIKEIVVHRFLHAELFITPIWWLHPKKWRLDRLIEGSHDFIMTIIKKYKRKAELNESSKPDKSEANKDLSGDSSTKRDMKCLIECMLSQGATPEEVYYEIGTFLVAGHETTVTALKILLFDLTLYPHHQTKCREEVDELFNSKSSNPADFKINLEMDELTNLKYLERCIFESLRLTPVVPFFLRSIDSPLKMSDELILQAGTVVVFPPWLIHRDERYYPNPTKYDPQRFEPEEARQREPGSYIPFSASSRNCIGWKFAIMEMKIVTAWILRHFVISTDDNREDVKILFHATIKPERDYRVRLERRN